MTKQAHKPNLSITSGSFFLLTFDVRLIIEEYSSVGGSSQWVGPTTQLGARAKSPITGTLCSFLSSKPSFPGLQFDLVDSLTSGNRGQEERPLQRHLGAQI